MSHKDKSERRKAIYSEEFQEMLDKLEEEDYVDRSGIMGTKKSRIEHEKVKALEKHFEEDNKLQPERKVKIAEDVGLEPRQVAIWFQNRRARWKTKHLEREYDHLRASYDSLKLDYGSLQQEKLALLNQLQELKAKIDARSIQNNTSPSPSTIASMRSTGITNENTSMVFPFSMSTTSSSSMSNGFQVCKAYQEQLIRMDELGMLDNLSDASCNFFSSVDQAPSLHWQNGSNDFI